MFDNLVTLAHRIRPELSSLSEQRRLVGAGVVISTLFSLPLAVAGLVWLAIETDLSVINKHSLLFLGFFIQLVIFNRVNYFFIVEVREDRYGSADNSLSSMILWAAVFILGPSALWLSIVLYLVQFVRNWLGSTSSAARWNLIMTITHSLAQTTLPPLIAIAFYMRAGGVFPLPELSLPTVLLGLLVLTIDLLGTFLIWSVYIFYNIRIQGYLAGQNSIQPIIKFFVLSFGLPFLSNPFAILSAGLFVQNGWLIYIFLTVGLLLVALLARQLSWAAENNRQNSRQLEKLEQLGRSLLSSTPDFSALPLILEKHISNMFPSGRVAIWLENEGLIHMHPSDWPSVSDEAWNWLLYQTCTSTFLAKDPLPWETHLSGHNALLLTPIEDIEHKTTIGGVYLELRTLVQPWNNKSLANLIPAVQTLAAQVASYIKQIEIFQQTLAYQNIAQELQLAGTIQASFLPNSFPSIPGWQLAVTLLPARETSGDFFDVINLSGGRMGLLIADVADKGLGSALYMALSRTLIRTYAIEYDADPEVVFYAANGRLLNDARASLFVTAFYGILDPDSGTLTYCNAGHSPPILIRTEDRNGMRTLAKTGMPLGVESEATWTQEKVNLSPGDMLVLYTDGIPDSMDNHGRFFEEDSLIEIAQANIGLAAHELQSLILDKIQRFVGDEPQVDDITLMVLVRDV